MDFLDRVIAREGGSKITRDPIDPGGTTKYGISKRSFPDEDIENLTLDRARQLYERILMQANIDKIEDGYLREHVFDFAVHSGPKVAVRTLQRLVGAKPDGEIGPETLQLTNSHVYTFNFYLAFMRERLIYLARVIQNRPPSMKYFAGWVSRVLSI
jgi:lysozyme family protein